MEVYNEGEEVDVKTRRDVRNHIWGPHLFYQLEFLRLRPRNLFLFLNLPVISLIINMEAREALPLPPPTTDRELR